MKQQLKQVQVMVMQPNQPMVAYGEVPILETRDASQSNYRAADILNYLRCGCRAVQFSFSSTNKTRQAIFLEMLEHCLQHLCLKGESVRLEITTQDEKGLVVLITRQIQPKKS